jgi:hypothetical protein
MGMFMGIATMVIKHGQLNNPTQKKAEHTEHRTSGIDRSPSKYLSGWWFGTFVIFPYIGNNME